MTQLCEEKTALKFSVPFNGDFNLLKKISKYHVAEIYGCATTEGLGSGRAAGRLRPVSFGLLQDVYKWCTNKEIEFNYLINSPYYHEDILYNFDNFKKNIYPIIDIGIKKFTISLPQLASFLKKAIPDCEICVSQFANVCSGHAVNHWKNLGAKSIYIGPDIIRNLDLIKHLSSFGVGIRTVANNACIVGCPLKTYHGIFESNHSLIETTNGYNDYCTTFCRDILISKAQNILCSGFIRPEDLNLYVDSGIELFKIVDRNRDTNWIVNALEAYSNQKFAGNLAELLGLFKLKQIHIENSITTSSSVNYNDIFIDNSILGNDFSRIVKKCNPIYCDGNNKACNTMAVNAIRISNSNGGITT